MAIPALASDPADVTAGPRAAVAAFTAAAAAGDKAAAERALYPEVNEDRILLETFARLAVAKVGYRHAMEARFGPAAAGVFKAARPLDGPAAHAAPCRVAGDTATFTPGGPPIVVRRVGTAWRVPLAAIADRVENVPVEQLGTRYESMIQAFDEARRAVDRGDFPDAGRAAAATDAQVTAAAQGRDVQ